MQPITTKWVQTLADGMSRPHALIFAYGYAWVGDIGSAPGVLSRFDPANPSGYSSIVFPVGTHHDYVIDVIDIPSRNRIYVLFMNSYYASSGRVVVTEVNPTTLAWRDVINSAAYPVGSGSFCSDETSLYISTSTYTADPAPLQSVLLRYTIPGDYSSSWTLAEALPLSYGGLELLLGHNCRYDGTAVYVSSVNSDLTTYLAVARVNVSSTMFVEDGSPLVLLSSDYAFTDDSAFSPDGTEVWYGSETTGNVITFNKANLGAQSKISTGFGTACWGVYNDGPFMLA